MGFAVYPPALRTYAKQLADAQQAAEIAKRYVDKHGGFGAHDKGLLGMVLPHHEQLVGALDQMLTHLRELTEASSRAMDSLAAHYESADVRADATADAAYPAVPRPPVQRD
jgi:hypothetical protein